MLFDFMGRLSNSVGRNLNTLHFSYSVENCTDLKEDTSVH